MLLTVREFIHTAKGSMPTLVSKLQAETGRGHEQEAAAWKDSLTAVASMLEHADLGDFHVQLNGRTGDLALEYRLPAASSWCDLVLLGRGETAPAAVMVELKHWNVAGDRPGPRPGLIEHKGANELHPSEQVRGYVEYCQRFHSAVVEERANVSGCAFLTRADRASAYSRPPHGELVVQYPVFTSSTADVSQHLPAYLRQRLRKPDPVFASQFAKGTYRQDRDFVRALAATLADSKDALVLLDHQRKGFELCMQAAEETLTPDGTQKALILIEGPPGSGKSVVAARVWSELARKAGLPGDFVFVTTSDSQKKNWQAVFERHGKSLAARGVVKPANAFNPGLDGRWLSQLKKRGKTAPIADWRRNLEDWARKSGQSPRIENDSISVSVVDEAHALIDPTVEGGAGNRFSGWTFPAGPQIWHILRASRLTLLFLDPEQSYRDNETTTEEAITAYAKELGVKVLPKISLAGAQFRCAGSKEYVDWIDALLAGKAIPGEAAKWLAKEGTAGFEFEMVADPAALDEALEAKIEAGKSVRLLAAYGRGWKTKNESKPHRLLPSQKDFHIAYSRDGRKAYWSKIWNYAPKADYTQFIQAPEDSEMHADVLAEVGCPYVVRGFDFDYIGLLWLADLVWRKDRWVAQIDGTFESAWPKTLSAAKKERDAGVAGPAHADLLRRAIRGYRILFTRPIKGCYVWCEDAETRAYLASRLADA